MKTIKIAMTTALLAIAITQTAQAADEVFLKSPLQFGGTGCVGDSVVITDENTASMSILFTGYDAGKNAVSGLQRASCHILVPIHVNQGWQVLTGKVL